MAKMITIASGKGGVGKTSISLNLSLALAASGQRVCLFDADLGLANVNILTGLYPDHGLGEVIAGSHCLTDIMIRDFNGIDIIPGSSGVEKLADLTGDEARRLINSFLDLSSYDYFILDTSAGISSQVLSFCRASHEMILVATPEPTSLTDAYSLLKVLSRGETMPEIRVVINQVKSAARAKQAYSKLKKTVKKFLSVKISPLGIVARDSNVSIAVISQVPFFMLFPDTMASRCIRSIVQKLLKDEGKDMPVEVFWDQCLSLLSKGGSKRLSEPAVPDRDDNETGIALGIRLANIENKVAILLDEMGQIKTLLGQAPQPGMSEPVLQESTPEQVNSASPPIDVFTPISLDFEAWLTGKQ